MRLEKFIRYSKDYISYLKEQKTKNFNNFIIRPLNITIKFRTDLSKDSTLPNSTIAITMTPLIVSIDFTIANEVQALMKLIKYHSDDIENKVLRVYKSDINDQINEEQKQIESILPKNQNTKLLMELLKLKMTYEYCLSNGKSIDLVIFPDSEDQRVYQNIHEVEKLINHFKIILEVEKLAIVQYKVEKYLEAFKADFEKKQKQESNLTFQKIVSWLPGYTKYDAEEQDENQAQNDEIGENIDELITKYSSLINRNVDIENPDKVTFHMTIAVSLFEVIMFNSAGPINQPQIF